MRSPGIFLGLVLATLLWCAEPSYGQMFGNRTRPGTPATPGTPAGGAGNAGSTSSAPRSALSSINSIKTDTSGTGGASLLRGNERFLRANRRPGNFVGADARERREFVGVQQSEAPEPVAPELTPLPGGRSPLIADLATPFGRRAGVYEPRLIVGFATASPPAGEVNETLTRRLRSIPGLDPANRIEVLVEGRTAALRGEVVSERDRTLAEQLILFEPGISAVRNDLKVRPPQTRPAEARPTEPPPADQSPRTTLPRARRAVSQPKK